jgi:hypothetical protein
MEATMECKQLPRWIAGVIGVGVLGAGSGTARAQAYEPEDTSEPPREESRSAWRYVAEAYAPIPLTMTTDITLGDQMETIESDAGDLADKYRAGASLRFEAWYRRRFGLVLDGGYLQVADSTELPGGTPVGVSARTFALDVLGGFRALDYGGAERWPAVALELHAGVRGEYVEARIGVGDRMTDEGEGIFKFAGAVVVPIRLTERWWLRTRATVAAWHGTSLEALGYFEYDFDPVALALGYQYDLSHSDSGALEIESDSHNIYLSFTLRYAGEG